MNISLIGGLFSGVINYFTMDKKDRNAIKATKVANAAAQALRSDELDQAKHSAAVSRITNTDKTIADYDLIAQENARHSIVDDILVFWVIGVVSLMFVPDMQPYMIKGFDALNKAPVWFQTLIVGSFISKLGLRFLFSPRKLLGLK